MNIIVCYSPVKNKSLCITHRIHCVFEITYEAGERLLIIGDNESINCPGDKMVAKVQNLLSVVMMSSLDAYVV
jgi:hypothetical protein